eukprot:1680423-Pyramimonas_sp.AAC.1
MLGGSTAWARGVPSVWSSPLVLNLAIKKEDNIVGVHQKFKGLHKLHYNGLCRFMLREKAASTGEVGPLWLFAWEKRQRCATWLARKRPTFRMPWSWWTWQIAQSIYGLLKEV